jgi:hypothetical protein
MNNEAKTGGLKMEDHTLFRDAATALLTVAVLFVVATMVAIALSA